MLYFLRCETRADAVAIVACPSRYLRSFSVGLDRVGATQRSPAIVKRSEGAPSGCARIFSEIVSVIMSGIDLSALLIFVLRREPHRRTGHDIHADMLAKRRYRIPFFA